MLRMRNIARNPAALGDLLRARRRALKLTQQELSDTVGASRQAIARLEHGEPAVHLDTALRVAQALGVDVWLESRQ